jgi:hypothetical protein
VAPRQRFTFELDAREFAEQRFAQFYSGIDQIIVWLP